jgi:hypothetical protein
MEATTQLQLQLPDVDTANPKRSTANMMPNSATTQMLRIPSGTDRHGSGLPCAEFALLHDDDMRITDIHAIATAIAATRLYRSGRCQLQRQCVEAM